MSRRLTLGLVLLAAVVAGTVLGLLLISPSGPDPAPSPTPPAIPASTSEPPDAADVAAVSVLANTLVDVITRHDSAAFGKLTCRPQTAEALTRLQKTWDAAGAVTASLQGKPEIRGESATVTVHVKGAKGMKDTPFPLRKQDDRWCVPG